MPMSATLFPLAPSFMPGYPSVSASCGHRARPSTSFSTSRARNVTGPRRAVPPVE